MHCPEDIPGGTYGCADLMLPCNVPPTTAPNPLYQCFLNSADSDGFFVIFKYCFEKNQYHTYRFARVKSYKDCFPPSRKINIAIATETFARVMLLTDFRLCFAG
jgi:hypothetical protein